MVVTFNIKHYIPLSIQYFEDGKEHYGIVVSKAISQGELQRRVTKLLESVTAEELMNGVMQHIVYLLIRMNVLLTGYLVVTRKYSN